MHSAKRPRIIMVQPLLGMAGSFVRHPPLGLLYACSQLDVEAIDIHILDARLHPSDWQERLAALLEEPSLAVGISVMTGKPILHAMRLSALAKRLSPQTKVVWGGPFATFHPEYILRDEPACDYVVSGYGAAPFKALLDALREGRAPEGIPGVSFRRGQEAVAEPPDMSAHEIIPHRQIPYDLIQDYSPYGQLDQDNRIFSLYSAMGCVYRCAFCSSPALYRQIKGKRWTPLPVSEVADHIAYVVEHHQANYIYFIDDDSFVDLGHVEAVIDEIERRGIKVRLGFRGARINEIKRMDDAFLRKLVRAGTDILHIGAESGSDRILSLVRKDCTVADILECNAKLARHPIQPFYNFIVGLPTETEDDLKATASLMLRLIEGNSRTIVGTPNLFRPLPGTELFDLARTEWGYTPPANLQEFSEVEVEGEYSHPWFTPRLKRLCEMMLVSSYFADDKIRKMTRGKNLFYKFMRLVSSLYAPVARWRLRHAYTGLFLEGPAYRLASRLLAGTRRSGRDD